MPNPPQGKFGAVTDTNGPGTRIHLSRSEARRPDLLEMTVFYINGFDGLSGYSNRFVTPRTLALNAGPNQQFRVDLLDPSAAVTR